MSRQQMEISRFEISSVFVGNRSFPTFFDEDFGLGYSDKGTLSCASYSFVATFCDHFIGQSVTPGRSSHMTKAMRALHRMTFSRDCPAPRVIPSPLALTADGRRRS
jgi:hypothetical protein